MNDTPLIMDPASLSATLQSLSEQLQVEKNRLSSFMSLQDPSFVQAFTSVQHLQSSLSSLGLSLEELPDLQTVVSVRDQFQSEYSTAATVLEIHSNRSRFEDCNEDLYPLVTLLSQQEAKLRTLKENQKDDFLLTAAQDIVNKNHSRLVVQVTNMWDDLVVCGKNSCTVRGATGTITLKSVHEMMELLGELENKVNVNGKRLGELLGKLIAEDCIDEEKTGEMTKITLGREKHDGSLSSILENVSKFLQFLYTDYCLREESVFQFLDAALNLPATLFPVLKQKLLHSPSSSRPKDLSSLTAFVSTLCDLQYPSQSLHFLQRIIADAEAEIVTFRCEMMLEKTRELILCQDSMNRSVSDQTEKWSVSSKQGKRGDSKLVFEIDKMQVSDSVIKIVEKLQDFMQEAVKKPTAAALEMLICARACVQLFYCLRHYSQEVSIRNSHISSALFHNDCLYFSHHLVLISTEIGPHMPATVSGLHSISDFEPLIKSKAMDCFLYLCEDVKKVIDEKMKQLNVVKLSGNFENAEETALAVVSQITTEAKSLENVLSQNDFSHFLGTIVEFAIESLVEKILNLDQIARDDETALQQIIDLFLGLGQLFSQSPSEFVASWRKLEVVKEILENDMNGILKLFAEGKVAEALTFEELTKLIEAMFEDSPKRRESLKVMTGIKGS